MTIDELWESHTFHTLLNDLFKARKDPAMGKIRLKVLLDFIGVEQPVTGGSARRLSTESADGVSRGSAPTDQKSTDDFPKGTELPPGFQPFQELQANTDGENFLNELKSKLNGLQTGMGHTLVFSSGFPAGSIPNMLEQIGAPFTMPEGAQMVNRIVPKQAKNGQPVNENYELWQVKLAPK